MGRKRVALIGADYEHKRKIVSGLGITSPLLKVEGISRLSYIERSSDSIHLNILDSELLKPSEEDPKELARPVLSAALRDRDVILLQFDASQEDALSKLKDTIAYLKQNFNDDVSKITLVGTHDSTQDVRVSHTAIEAFARENGLNETNSFLINLGAPNDDIGDRLDGVKHFIAPANSVVTALDTAKEAVSAIPPHHKRAYDKLWKENRSAKDNMIALLDDYAKGNSGFKLFFTAHANRNRNRKATKAVNQIVTKLKKGSVSDGECGYLDYGIQEAYRDLCKITVKEGGSLHSRLTFLKAELLESEQLRENLQERSFKVDTNNSRIFTPRA